MIRSDFDEYAAHNTNAERIHDTGNSQIFGIMNSMIVSRGTRMNGRPIHAVSTSWANKIIKTLRMKLCLTLIGEMPDNVR